MIVIILLAVIICLICYSIIATVDVITMPIPQRHDTNP